MGLYQGRSLDPRRPRLLNNLLPWELEVICLKCLEKEPRRRYPTAQALADDLTRWLNGLPIQARPVGRLGRARRWARRNPVAASLAATALALLVVLAVGFATAAIWLDRAYKRAEKNLTKARDA